MFTLIIAAAPRPCSARAATSALRLQASALASDAARKKAMPPRWMRRAPKRSANAANGSSAATTASW